MRPGSTLFLIINKTLDHGYDEYPSYFEIKLLNTISDNKASAKKGKLIRIPTVYTFSR